MKQSSPEQTEVKKTESGSTIGDMAEKAASAKLAKRGASRVFFICLGSLTLALGTLGIFLPLLPTVPLYLVTTFAYAKSSRRLNEWFCGTKLYKSYLASYVQNRAMTRGTKAVMISTLFVSFTLAEIFTWNVFIFGKPLMRFLHPLLFTLLTGYFLFGVKTMKKET